MRSIKCLAIGVMMGTAAAAAVADTQVAGDSDIVLIEGRAAVEGGAKVMGYPGVTAHLRTDGTGLTLHYTAASEKVMVDVQVGTGEFVRHHLQQGEHELVLFADLPPATRSVQIVKRTEGWQGLLTLRGWEVAGGELIAPKPLPERRLLFVGDSITAGAATDFREGDSDDGFSASNGRYSYGFQLARMLDAQVHLVGFGGKGLVRDWQGLRSEVTAPEYYDQTLPTEEQPRWDHASWVPDAVFVCLGTNDFNQGIPDEQDWVAAYREFLQKIRRDAPDAPIFLLESPMHGDDPPTISRHVVRHYHEATIAATGDGNIHPFATGYHPGETNSHPDKHGQRRVAEELLLVVRAKLGW